MTYEILETKLYSKNKLIELINKDLLLLKYVKLLLIELGEDFSCIDSAINNTKNDLVHEQEEAKEMLRSLKKMKGETNGSRNFSQNL